MFDLLLGGPGETPETAADTVEVVKQVAPDCVGAALGIRLYPGTAITRAVEHAARDEHAMVKDGEVLVRFHEVGESEVREED